MLKHNLLNLLNSNKGKGHFSIVNTAEQATIYVYDTIVSSSAEANYFGGVSPEGFVKEVASITAPVINLRINSPGGSAFGTVAMQQALRETKAVVIAHIDGVAASAASTLAMAAKEIRMAPGAMIMIHKAMTLAVGNEDDMLNIADALSKTDQAIAAAYSERTGKPVEQIMNWMAAETWFTAQQAIDNKFADKMAETAVKNEIKWDLDAYDNAPKQIDNLVNFDAERRLRLARAL